MSSRDSDGRFRNHNKPTVVSASMVRAQWVETESARLKREGFTFEEIADLITQVGRGQKVPVTSLPEGITFPPEYKITPMGCHKATRRALRRAPNLEANEMRQVDTDRCEKMYLFLTPGIRQGDPKSVRAAINVLAHKAAINGYKSPEIEVRVAVALFKEAMTLLLQGGSRVDELAEVAGLEAPSVEVTARKVEGDENN